MVAKKLSSSELPSSSPWQLDISLASNHVIDESCIGIAESHPPEEILKLATERGFKQICQKQGFGFEDELQAAHQFAEDPEKLLNAPVHLILNSADQRDSIVLEFKSSAEKHEVLERLNKFMESKDLSQTLKYDAVAVADELFTNAMYNAPFVDSKTHHNPGVSRHEIEVTYHSGRTARLIVGIDGTRLFIGCQDPFGTLDLPAYLEKVRQTYIRGPAATMNFGSGGAGLGSYIIFNTGSSLYFGVWPGRATVICCVLPIGLSNRKRAQIPKHLHWFQNAKGAK